MTDGSPTGVPAPSDPPAAAPAAPVEPTAQAVGGTEAAPEAAAEGRTAEEVEAIWKNRVAGKDRAHAQEAATLRNQNADLTARLTALEREKEARDMSELSEAEQWKAKAEAAERALAEERNAAALRERRAKYGEAAEALDEQTFVGMDEAKLAALNARLSGGTPPPVGEQPTPEPSPAPAPSTPPVLPNQAPRTSSAPTNGPRDRSVEELESDLERQAPGWQASLTD